MSGYNPAYMHMDPSQVGTPPGRPVTFRFLQPCHFCSGCHKLEPSVVLNLFACVLQVSIFQTDSGQLYSSAMQGLSSYANNIMGHTMNQYAAQSSLLSTQVAHE